MVSLLFQCCCNVYHTFHDLGIQKKNPFFTFSLKKRHLLANSINLKKKKKKKKEITINLFKFVLFKYFIIILKLKKIKSLLFF